MNRTTHQFAQLTRGIVTGALLLAAPYSLAVPILQLYVEGATYDAEHESWVFEALGADPIRLWVIGNVDGPGGKGTIADVKLAVTYRDAGAGKDINVTVTSGQIGGTGSYGGFADPSTPDDPTFLQFNEDGDIPLMGDGSPIASHGVYGDGWEWQEFGLGDLELTDSQIGNFIDAFPTPSGQTLGQINAYEISVDAAGPMDIHFDAYDHVGADRRVRYVFAPYSHDAETGINEPCCDDGHGVPETTTAGLMTAGLALLALSAIRRRQRS